MTGKKLEEINVFISSPSDVNEERKIALGVIEQLNSMHHIADRYALKALAYENDVPPAVGEKPQKIVDRYMMRPDQADILICILWSRMGTEVIDEEGKEYKSGTEYEFFTAYKANQKYRKPIILLYRCMKSVPSNNIDSKQIELVRTFFKRFEGIDAEFEGLYKKYESNEEFKRKLFQDIDKIISNFSKHYTVSSSKIAVEGIWKKLHSYKKLLIVASIIVAILIILIGGVSINTESINSSKSDFIPTVSPTPDINFIKKTDSKILSAGETWEIGNGRKLTLIATDNEKPRKAALFITIPDKNISDDTLVLTENQKFTYKYDFFIMIDKIFSASVTDIIKVEVTNLTELSPTPIITPMPQFMFKKVIESKTLTPGEPLEIGDGYKLQFMSIDRKAMPREVWLEISRNGKIVDDIFLTANEKYNYNNVLIFSMGDIVLGDVGDLIVVKDIYIAEPKDNLIRWVVAPPWTAPSTNIYMPSEANIQLQDAN